MADVLLLGGPCDPRRVTMPVTVDADAVFVRPMPYDCHDVYAVIDRVITDGTVESANARYLHTEGSRHQIDQYRRTLAKLGTGRAFAIRKERVK